MPARPGHVLLSHHLRRGVILGALSVVALATAIALLGAVLARGAPSWWRTVRRDDPATIKEASHVEEALSTLLYRGRPTDPSYTPESGLPWRSEPWSFKIKDSEANAWLNVRLRMWLANQEEDFVWPEEISQVQVDFADGRVRIGARVRVGGRDQILSATVDPEVDGEGSFWAPARYVHVGRLAIPASWVLETPDPGGPGYVPKDLRGTPELNAMLKAFRGEMPFSGNAAIKLGDGRRIRILGVRSEDGAIVVHCRTELQ